MDDISVGLGTAKAQSETAENCATCGRPLTQCGPNGECLRCLVSLTFLGDGEQPERPAARGRLTPGPLRYAHFEVETAADGFPVELGAGGIAFARVLRGRFAAPGHLAIGGIAYEASVSGASVVGKEWRPAGRIRRSR